MKKLSLLALSFFLMFNLFGQSQAYRDSCSSDIVKNSQYIFEGKIVRVESYYSSELKDCYRSYYIDVYKIFRDDDKLKYGTIEVIEKQLGGLIGVKRSEIIGFDDYYGLFFCNPTKLNIPLSKDFVTNNNLRLETYKTYSNISFIWDHVPDMKNIYNYLQSFDNIKIPVLKRKKRNLFKNKPADITGVAKRKAEYMKNNYNSFLTFFIYRFTLFKPIGLTC